VEIKRGVRTVNSDTPRKICLRQLPKAMPKASQNMYPQDSRFFPSTRIPNQFLTSFRMGCNDSQTGRGRTEQD